MSTTTKDHQAGQAGQAQQQHGRPSVQPIVPYFEKWCGGPASLAPSPIRADLITTSCEATVATLAAVRSNCMLMSQMDFLQWIDGQTARIQKIALEAAALANTGTATHGEGHAAAI